MNDLDGLPQPLTGQGETVADVWMVFLLIAIGVFALIVVLVAMVSLRHRRRSESLPSQSHYNIPVEIAYTLIPLLVVIGLFTLTVLSIRDVEPTIDDPELVVNVTAFQWQWEFEYPESGVVVRGEPEANPELVLPADTTVRFELETLDVIHSFWVPGFLYKRDIIPGSANSFDVAIGDWAGQTSNGQCAEFCGTYHARMGFLVRIVEPEEFDAWLDEQTADADLASITGGNP